MRGKQEVWTRTTGGKRESEKRERIKVEEGTELAQIHYGAMAS